jgi:hypothetical protein
MIEDLSIYFPDFGVPVVLHTDSGDIACLGIYDAAFLDTQLGETVLDTTSKRLLLRSCEVGTLKREDALTMGCLEFEVVRMVPDGTGLVTAMLTDVTDKSDD